MKHKNDFPHYSDERLGELILLIAKRSAKDPCFGTVKLNKLLFFSDFLAYAELGRSISGSRYDKQEFGPVAAHAVRVKKRLERRGSAVSQPVPMSREREQTRVVPLKEPNLKLFNQREREIVDYVVDQLWSLSANEVSELSHRFAGWKLAQLGEPIPYPTVVLPETPMELTEAEHRWAVESVARLAA